MHCMSFAKLELCFSENLGTQMRNVEEVLEKCRTRGVILSLGEDGKTVDYEAPSGIPTSLVTALKRHKKALIAHLKVDQVSYQHVLTKAIDDLNRTGAKATDLSEEDRRESLRLEHKMTRAAGERDWEMYVALVKSWRDLILRGCVRTLLVHSHVLGREITLRWIGDDPKVINVEGIRYTSEEVAMLKGSSSTEVRKVCEVKDAFQGIVTGEEGVKDA